MPKIDMSFIADGISGNWRVESFNVKAQEFSQMISYFKTGRSVPAGDYKKLMHDDVLVMSNTPDEIRDYQHFTRQAHGDILINGLGLGCTVQELLNKDEVKSITVIEKSIDVINLVAKHFNDPRITIIHADAFEWKPEPKRRFNFVWHDIWDFISADNLPEMTKLHRKYGRRADWQGSWAKDLCLDYRRENERYRY